ncbi:SigB/SigF/SigG family RNA polymerase sigma factor [Streptomyces sp. V4-01]|uniref:SigB/SigF/SigG family RNA polymerase sigma factor n=1 Tax=Actinacidiphila polyblastidii TaxID=3110430 RepID=A0ABU7PCD5_9ACTN|nr:SigB/SigF/SigG family RNA polymerase sigma factor [Streptomyces sp. V4-01]
MQDQRLRTPRTAGRQHDEPPESDELFRAMADATGTRNREAYRQRVIIAWMPMARRMAGRYRDRGESMDDLEQIAAVGLIKAVDGFDPDRGHAFASYAVPTIDGEIKRHFRDHLWSVHVPRAVQESRNRVRAACRELGSGPADAAPPVAVLVAHTGMAEKDVLAGLSALDSFSALSLDVALEGDGDGAALGSRIGGCDPAFDVVTDRVALGSRLGELPPRDRTILYLRYFRDMKQAEIAGQLGISQMHVSRLLSTICARVRSAVLDEHEPPAQHPAAA